MNYVLTFSHMTAQYACHAQSCSQAKSTSNVSLIEPEVFESIEAAQVWADADEQNKGGERAIFKACRCSRR